MSIETDLVALLSGVFNGSFFDSDAPVGTAAPYAVYGDVVSIEDVSLDTNGGTGNAYTTRLQIDIYASTPAQRKAKTDEVKASLKSWTVENVTNSEMSTHEPDTKLYRKMLDLTAWHY